MENQSRTSRTHRRSRSRRHSSHRSRSRSPRDSSAGGNNNQDTTLKQPQFIPIPVPYYQPTPTQPSTTQISNHSTNTTTNSQPMSYVIQPPKQQFIEEFIQPTSKPTNVLAYTTNQPSLIVSKPTQPVYTIAYRANNNGPGIASNILSGPAATTYVTAARNADGEIKMLMSDSDQDEKEYRTMHNRRRDTEVFLFHLFLFSD